MAGFSFTSLTQFGRSLERKKVDYSKVATEALAEAAAEILATSDSVSGGLAGAGGISINGTRVTISYPNPESKMLHESFDEVYSPVDRSKFLENSVLNSTDMVRNRLIEVLRRKR